MPRRHSQQLQSASKQEYRTPREYNVPIEPHGLIAEWKGDTLTVWEPSQWIDGMSRTYAEWFDVPFENVRLVSPYIGGGFGSKALPLEHSAVAINAARMLDRPVKLAVTRPQTFTAFGGRPATRQTIALGATREGKLLSIVHRSANETSMKDMFGRTPGLGHLPHVRNTELEFPPERRAGQYGQTRRIARTGRKPERLRHRMRDR